MVATGNIGVVERKIGESKQALGNKNEGIYEMGNREQKDHKSGKKSRKKTWRTEVNKDDEIEKNGVKKGRRELKDSTKRGRKEERIKDSEAHKKEKNYGKAKKENKR